VALAAGRQIGAWTSGQPAGIQWVAGFGNVEAIRPRGFLVDQPIRLGGRAWGDEREDGSQQESGGDGRLVGVLAWKPACASK
jgi:hypothetical protein